jgi:murein DD-endopeptidase / murein LD-carboxypeptidase
MQRINRNINHDSKKGSREKMKSLHPSPFSRFFFRFTLLPLLFTLFLFIGCAPSLRYTSHPDSSYHRSSSKTHITSEKQILAMVPASSLKTIVDAYIGTPYLTGGMSKEGTDCSGFSSLVYLEYKGIKLPRSSSAQAKVGRNVSKNDAREGDLVFFRGGMFGGINHVGVCMGNGVFAHASIHSGVRYDLLNDVYYIKRLVCIRRIN